MCKLQGYEPKNATFLSSKMFRAQTLTSPDISRRTSFPCVASEGIPKMLAASNGPLLCSL